MKATRLIAMIGATAIIVTAVWLITEPDPQDRKRPLAAPGVREVIDDSIHGICVVTATDGTSSVRGVMRFRSKGSGVEVSGCIKGLSPGKYRFIVTEFGDVRDIDSGSAGNAFFRSDLLMPSDGTAITDTMIIETDELGSANFAQLNPALTIYGPESIIGRCCLLYPLSASTSGTHVAEGVIGRANSKWSAGVSTPLTTHDAVSLDNC